MQPAPENDPYGLFKSVFLFGFGAGDGGIVQWVWTHLFALRPI